MGAAINHAVNLPLLLFTQNDSVLNISRLGGVPSSKLEESMFLDVQRILNNSNYAEKENDLVLDLAKAKLLDEKGNFFVSPVDELLSTVHAIIGLKGQIAILGLVSVTMIALVVAVFVLGFKLHSVQITLASLLTLAGRTNAEPSSGHSPPVGYVNSA